MHLGMLPYRKGKGTLHVIVPSPRADDDKILEVTYFISWKYLLESMMYLSELQNAYLHA